MHAIEDELGGTVTKPYEAVLVLGRRVGSAACLITSRSSVTTSRRARRSTTRCWRRSAAPASWISGRTSATGCGGKPDFWISEHATGGANRESHIAFVAADRDTVRAFFQAAVAIGAEVLHEPRVWPEYHPNYFGAFVRDPDGNNVEAVCHLPE